MSNLNVTKTAAGNQWALVDTPNPQEVTLAVFIDRTNIRLRDIPTERQVYSTWTQKWPELLTDYSNWVYSEMRNDAGPGNTAAFFWVRPRTQKERDTPYRTVWGMEQKYWPSILRWLRFDLDTVQNQANLYAYLDDRGSVYIPRYFVTKGWIPGDTNNTRVKTEFFLSDVPYPDNEFDHPGLEPGEVSWHFSDTEGGIPKCLHDDISVPGRQTVGTIVLDGVTNASDVQTGLSNRQFFPATEPTEWVDYVESDTQQLQNGQWHRVKVTLEAPPIPDISIEPAR